jgi:hypothetical protein
MVVLSQDNVWSVSKYPMPQVKKSRVTFDGRTIVDTNVLVRSPKVKEALGKLSEATRAMKSRGRVTILRRSKAIA